MSKIVVFLGFLLAVGSGNPAPQQLGREDSTADQQVSKIVQGKLDTTPFRLGRGITEFGNKLYSLLAKEQKGNVVFSPFSLHTALAMTYFGSPVTSDTHKELSQLLGMPTDFQQDYPTNFLQLLNRYENITRVKPTTKVQVANKMYTDRSFEAKQDFRDLLRIFFKTSQEQVDFGDSKKSVDTINQFVSGQTNGKITELLSPDDVDSLTKMILVNAIYFKSNWHTQFQPSKTAPGDFTVNGESFKHNEMMNTEGSFGVADFPNYKVLEMPYEDENLLKDRYLRMLVILPNEGLDIQSLDPVVETLNFTALDQRMAFGPVAVRFPKFKIGSKAELVPQFQRLGVKTLFDPNLADLTDITSSEKVAVEHVVHQAELEVTEEGSEAAAATAVSIGTRTVGGKRNFFVDKPFVFVIHDKAFNVPLFMGRVVDPTGVRSLKTSSSSPVARVAAAQPNLSSEFQSTAADPCSGNNGLTAAGSITFPCKGHEASAENQEKQQQQQQQQDQDNNRQSKFLSGS